MNIIMPLAQNRLANDRHRGCDALMRRTIKISMRSLDHPFIYKCLCQRHALVLVYMHLPGDRGSRSTSKNVQRRWAYAEAGWSRIASLAPAVLQCAEEGDSVAFKIVTSAAHEALEAVMTVATKTKLRGQRFKLVLSGACIPCTVGRLTTGIC